MNTKFLLFSLFFLGFITWGCQKDMLQEIDFGQGKILSEVNAEDLAIAMQWYENHQIEQFSTRSGVHHPLFEVSVPDWETCIAAEDGICKTVETYLNILNRGLFLNSETAKAYEETGDERYLRMLTRLVVMTQKESNKVIGFYMTIVPSKDYLEKTGFRSLGNNSYTVRSNDLDGYVLYHELNGNFINGWIYEKGKITAAINAKVPDSSIQTRAGTMVCIDHFSQTCTDWYSSGGGETHYAGTTCDMPVYEGSDCYSTGGSGVGGGGGVGDFGGGGSISTTKNKPSYTTLSSKFNEVAKMESADVYKKIGGLVYTNYLSNPTDFANACGLRLSYALNQMSGHEIRFVNKKTISGDTNSDGTKEWYYYRVTDLSEYLNKTYGTAKQVTREQIQGIKGIIRLTDCGWGDASGHIDLWDGTAFLSKDYPVCNIIYFWELK